jgi:hypothetical protein
MPFKKCPDEGRSTTRSTGKSPEPEQLNKMKPLECLQAAQRLLDCFRTGDANNPETFGTAIAAVFSHYSREVVEFVCDPSTGLPGRLEWMPSVAAVKSACDARVAELATMHRFEHWGEQQLLANETRAEQGPLKPTLDDLHAKYGKTWGIADEVVEPAGNGAGMVREEVIKHYQTHRLDGQLKAEPDAAPDSPYEEGVGRVESGKT